MTVLLKIFVFLTLAFFFAVAAIVIFYLPYLCFKQLFKKPRPAADLKKEKEDEDQTIITISIDEENLRKLREKLRS